MTMYLIYLLLGLPVIVRYAEKYKLFTGMNNATHARKLGNLVGFTLTWHIWIIILLLGKHK